MVTAKRADFRKLLAREPRHAGAIIVEGLEREPSRQQIQVAIGFIELQDRPADDMVNRIVEVSARNGVIPYEWSGNQEPTP